MNTKLLVSYKIIGQLQNELKIALFSVRAFKLFLLGLLLNIQWFYIIYMVEY